MRQTSVVCVFALLSLAVWASIAAASGGDLNNLDVGSTPTPTYAPVNAIATSDSNSSSTDYGSCVISSVLGSQTGGVAPTPQVFTNGCGPANSASSTTKATPIGPLTTSIATNTTLQPVSTSFSSVSSSSDGTSVTSGTDSSATTAPSSSSAGMSATMITSSTASASASGNNAARIAPVASLQVLFTSVGMASLIMMLLSAGVGAGAVLL